MARPSKQETQKEKKMKPVRMNEWDKLLLMYQRYKQQQQLINTGATYGYGRMD